MINFTFVNLVQDGCSPLEHRMVVSEVQNHFSKIFPDSSFLLFNAVVDSEETLSILQNQSQFSDILFVVGNAANTLLSGVARSLHSRALVLSVPCALQELNYHIPGLEAEVRKQLNS